MLSWNLATRFGRFRIARLCELLPGYIRSSTIVVELVATHGQNHTQRLPLPEVGAGQVFNSEASRIRSGVCNVSPGRHPANSSPVVSYWCGCRQLGAADCSHGGGWAAR